MNNEEILKLAFAKSSTTEEAKKTAEWMKRFLTEDAAKLEKDRQQVKLREQQLLNILGKPIDDPDFHVDRNQLDFPFGDPVKRTRKNSDAKRNGHKISPEELEYVTRKLPTIKTVEEFNAIANELDRSPGAISEWVSRAYVKIDHLRLPPAVFPKLYRKALKAAKEKAEANG